MKITIITVCFNAVEASPDALDSVATQSYPHIEQIVVDGGSSDAILDILRSGRGRVVRWVSEPDRGIYDAMKKALR